MFEQDSLGSLLKKAGIDQSPKQFSKRFFPLILVPALVSFFSIQLALVLFLVFLRSPHILAHFMAKKRHRRVIELLPAAISHYRYLSLSFDPIKSLSELKGFGPLSEMTALSYQQYSQGRSLKKSIEPMMIFPETEEFARTILFLAEKGTGRDILDKMSHRRRTELVSLYKRRNAKFQTMVMLFTTFSTVVPAVLASFRLAPNFSTPSLFPIMYGVIPIATILMMFSWEMLA
ncbi:MAG: hypothetical protein GOU99_01210 [Candidatus Altiarchaeota archaeon]|nr:hypothetical protein [Candidatus Altiarchaeota archaeon]